MYANAGDSIPPTSRRCRVPAVQGFSGKYRSLGEDDFPENRLRHDLALPVRGRATFACGMESAVIHVFSFLAGYALASPADMYLALPVTFPDQQALDDGHSDVKLLSLIHI